METEGCHNRGDDWIGLGNNLAPFQSPEATSTAARGYFDVPFYLNQVSWTMPVSSRLLLEAGYTPFRYNPIFGHPSPDGITNLIPVTEQSNAINPATGQRYAPQATYLYRGMQSWGWAVGKTDGWQAMASYVTGAHNMKVGYQGNRLDQLDQTIANQTQLAYRFNQGVPNAVSYWLPDFGRRTITSLHGIFAQDSWTHRPADGAGRAALRPGVELRAGRTERHHADVVPESGADHHRADARRQRLSTTSRRASASPTTCSATGKTAIKFNWGHYLAYAANDPPYTSTNPGFTVVRDVQNRGWTDTATTATWSSTATC